MTAFTDQDLDELAVQLTKIGSKIIELASQKVRDDLLREQITMRGYALAGIANHISTRIEENQ